MTLFQGKFGQISNSAPLQKSQKYIEHRRSINTGTAHFTLKNDESKCNIKRAKC